MQCQWNLVGRMAGMFREMKYESWHYRYVGMEVAEEIFNSKEGLIPRCLQRNKVMPSLRNWG